MSLLTGIGPRTSCAGLLWDMVRSPKESSLMSCLLTFMRVVWYFFNDIYPSTHNGYRPMDPPGWWIRLFERQPQQEGETDVDVHAAALNRDVGAPAMDVR